MDLKTISYKIDNGVAYIGFGKAAEKSLTVLDEQTLLDLKAAVDDIKSKERELKGAIIHSVTPGCFLAGADISLINSLTTEAEGAAGSEKGQELYNVVDDLLIPVVCCVDGVCLGGGLELALACDEIIVSDSKKTSLGLPEVQLGLLPGFGGTYRLPRKIGLVAALDYILTGKRVDGKKAKKIGLATEVYPAEKLLEMAPKHFRKVKSKTTLKEFLGELAGDNFLARRVIFQKARESLLKKTKGFYYAPLKIIDVLEKGSGRSRSSYLAIESQAFGELLVSEQSKNLRHLFFLMEGSKKFKGGNLETVVSKKLTRGAVLGAGTMGGGIAWLMSDAGMAPIMKDLNVGALNLGLKQASSNFKGALKRKKISSDEFSRKMRSIHPRLDYGGFSRVDLVVEAVVEDMGIKKKIFSDIESRVSEDCLITSNTSSLSVTEMATVFKKPERFLGLHFFNPVNKMPLVEIITHDKVSQEAVQILHKWVVDNKKTPVVVKDGPGFLVNRILSPYLNEAAYLLEEGVSVDAIDKAALNFGMPMGPLRLMDEIGLDVAVKVGKIMHEGLGERMKPSELSKKLIETGLLGKKSNEGFYKYSDENNEGVVNNKLSEYLPAVSVDMDEVTIQMRLFLPMINEAAQVLEDGIVETANDVDLGLIFGIGFPPFRGGPLRYADNEGADRIVTAIERFGTEVSGQRYQVCKFLKNIAEKSGRFYN